MWSTSVWRIQFFSVGPYCKHIRCLLVRIQNKKTTWAIYCDPKKNKIAVDWQKDEDMYKQILPLQYNCFFFLLQLFLLGAYALGIFWTFPILRSNGAKYASYQVSAKHCMHFKLISKSEPTHHHHGFLKLNIAFITIIFCELGLHQWKCAQKILQIIW